MKRLLLCLLLLPFLLNSSFSQVIITEWSQGTGSDSEWVEIAVQSNTDLRGWQFGDNRNGIFTAELTFNSISQWENVAANTIIVIYNGGDLATSITNVGGEDTDFSDKVVFIPHDNATFFTDETGGSVWPNFGLFTNGDATDKPALADGDGTLQATVTSPDLAANELAFLDGASLWQTGEDPMDATPGSSPLVLPVELLYFDAYSEGSSVIVNWKTASELNNDYFLLEKSRDGRLFQVIASIPGQGTSRQAHSYSWTDNETSLGDHYYRLQQIDFDGTTTIFDIQVVTITNGSSVFSVYPTVIRDQFWVERNDIVTQTEKYTLWDAQGKLLQSGIWPAEQTRLLLSIQSNYRGGVYFTLGNHTPVFLLRQ